MRESDIYLFSSTDFRDEAQEVGASGFFNKHADFEALMNWAKAQKGKRVVLIDDSPESLAAFKMNLELKGASEVYTFTDPEEALQAIPDLDPDVVLSDVQMPGLSGLELTKRLRNKQR